MGWSCTAAANDTMKILTAACLKQTKSQNVFRANGKFYMWELGRENDDGAITPSVQLLTDEHNRPLVKFEGVERMLSREVARLRIEPDGSLGRMPIYLKNLIRGEKALQEVKV